jgi:putative addiction module killer protein
MELPEVYKIRGSDESKRFLDELKGTRAAGYLRGRIKRARAGNFGKVESVGGGVYEMKHDTGPGYRLYYFQLAKDVFQLLCGGDKSTQVEDVKYAKSLKYTMEKDYEREIARSRSNLDSPLSRRGPGLR